MEMMAGVTIPPFERFYEDHRDEVLTRLRRLLGREAAEDAFQETFLRALRGYPKLVDARNLRAWVLTIATRVAIDTRRSPWEYPDIPDLETVDEPLPYEELRELTSGLPAKERSAVVLRYGYDLSYGQIGDLLGSNAEAARQAASSGVRRLRRKEKR
jgi:RNA polymerase sigma factor (sigma-70 family)